MQSILFTATVGRQDIVSLAVVGSFAMFMAIFAFLTRPNPESAERFRWKGFYIFGRKRTWEWRNKYVPIFFLFISIACLLIAAILAIINLF